MKIGINASFARKSDSGMGQVTVNFLKTLGKVADSKDEFFIYLEEDLNFKLPRNFRKKIIKPFYKRDDLIRKIYWEKFLLPMEAQRDRCQVFFSLYQSPTIMKRIPHMMLVHDAILKIFPWYINNFRKKVYYKKIDKGIEAADKIMTVSKHSKLDIVRLYNKKEKEVVANHEDCDPIFKKRVALKEINKTLRKFKLKAKNYIFYVGGFDMRKNVNGLIQAYGILWSEYKNKKDCPDLALAGKFNSHLVPVVTDIEAEIDNVRCKFGIPRNKFKLLGFVEQSNLPALYRGASLFCFPSLYEGFGLPVLEAFNSECSVVTSTNSSLKEMARKKNAFIFDLESDKNLAEKISEGLRKHKMRERKIIQAKKDAEKFNWETFVKNVLKELKKLNKKND
ncbi:MAG: glycosyltransferase family 4 protein [Candidatus Moranbacteria bacterium]|nr:glycosyltransferase family 4 protein [Candidatus Moranbacteria bacterium]